MTTKEKQTFESLFEELEQLKKTLASKQNKMEVVVAGDVKAGKSTLINALFKDEKLCETGVVRATMDNKVIESEHYFIIDTPGINANEHDTEVAELGYEKADFFLFTHNAKDGELLAKEVEFLKEIKNRFKDASQFARNTFIIITNAHQLDEKELALITEKIQMQIQTTLKVELQLFVVDSLSYLKAYLENKQLLMKSSGIPNLELALINSAIKFNQNSEKERDEILSIKKEGFLNRIVDIEKDAKEDLLKIQSGIVDFKEIKSLLKELKEYPNKVTSLLTDLKKTEQHLGVYVDVSMNKLFAMAHKVSYKSAGRATAEGLQVLRDHVMPKVEKAYIKKRQEIISFYRELLPNFNGIDSAVTKTQKKIEMQLVEFKKELIPVIDLLELKHFDNINTTLDIPLANVDNAVFQHSSSLYASEFEDCYDVESPSWYELWIETDESFTYKRGLFGEKEIEIYGYNILPAYDKVKEHLDTSIQSAHSIVKAAYQELCTKYNQLIRNEVNRIINDWTQILSSEVEKEDTFNKQIKENTQRIEQRLEQLEQLKKDLNNL